MKSINRNRIFFFLSVVLATTNLSHARVDCDGASKEKCRRLKELLSKWPKADIEGIDFVVVKNHSQKKNTATAEIEQQDLQDAIAESEVQEAAEAGPCRYDDDAGVVKIEKQVLDFTDFALTNCISAGIAGAMYSKVEDQFLSQIHENEAWVVKNGVLTKISVGANKTERASAEIFWMSMASSELQNYSPEKNKRELASATEASSENTVGPLVKRLLGF